MIFPSQLVPNSGDFVIEHLNDKEREAFVYSHVKPKYDKDCIFMYQVI